VYGVADARGMLMTVDKAIRIFALLSLLFVMGDMITTAIAMTDGGFRELNPLADSLMQKFGIYAGLAVFGVMSAFVFTITPAWIGLRVTKLKKFWLGVVIFFLVIRILTVANNIAVLLGWAGLG